MRKTEVVALVPGAYLVATRYPGWVQMAGFFWLEILPVTCLLLYSVGARALFFPLLHWLFLGVYEIGYWNNDRAATSSERVNRRRMTFEQHWLAIALVVRCTAWTVAVSLLALWCGAEVALAVGLASAAVFLLLLLHTRVGAMASAFSKFRIMTFAGLAFGKYAPAALALASALSVVQALGWVFLFYGGGRIVEYALIKVWDRPSGVFDVKALWYFASLIPAVVLMSLQDYNAGVLACLCVFGIYFFLHVGKRHVQHVAGGG